MNVKIFAASFVLIILLIPNNFAISAPNIDVNDDCKIKNDIGILKNKRQLDRLQISIGYILYRYGKSPEITDNCNELLKIIKSDGLKERFCNALLRFINNLEDLRDKLSVNMMIYFLFTYIISLTDYCYYTICIM